MKGEESNVASYEGYFENDMEHGYGKGIWKNVGTGLMERELEMEPI